MVLMPLLNVIAFNRMGDRSRTDGLTSLRAVWLGMLGGMGVVTVVTLAVAANADPHSTSIFPALIVGEGLFALGMTTLVRRRPLVGEPRVNDPDAVALAYRAKMFLSTALSEAPLLIGFVGVFIVGRAAMLFLGLPFAIIGFVMCAPTARDIQRRQEELISVGSRVSLLQALVG